MKTQAPTGRHGMVLGAAIALATCVGLLLTVAAGAYLAGGLWVHGLQIPAIAGDLFHLEETSTMLSLSFGILLGFLLALMLGGFFLIARLLAGRASGPGGLPFPVPGPPGVPFPFPFPMPPPGFDPAKLLDCLCGAAHRPGRGGPGDGVPNPWDLVDDLWDDVERLREKAEAGRKRAQALKEQLDRAVASAGESASQDLKDAQDRAGKQLDKVEQATENLVNTGASLAPRRPRW